VNAMPQPYYHIPKEMSSKKMLSILLSYFKKSEEPPTEPKKADDDPINPDNRQNVDINQCI
jgi:hypothetical protein